MDEPPRPGSARATLRTPEAADQIKQRIGELHTTLARMKALRKNLNDHFFEMGVLLRRIHDGRLFEAKGYSSFEAFAERELELGKSTCLRLSRVPAVFQEAAARSYGMDAVLAALALLDDPKPSAPAATPSSPIASGLPLKPPARH